VIRTAPLKRLADPVEIANSIVFLSSDMASWMTGATIDVNGGTLMV
jgi:NAD(P)-dependent dehydrogenase (short-subunit alcohol dehydrogenase family)